MDKPKYCKKEYLNYLNQLKCSGDTNMFGATSHIVKNFPELTEHKAGQILSYWMSTFENS